MEYGIDKLIVSDAAVEERIKTGIEKYRKGNFCIRTAAGEKVSVKLKNHKFRFGCNLFMLDEIPDDEEKNKLYRQKLADVFNMATLPFYWDAVEPEEGKTRYGKNSPKIYRRPPIDLCMEFCSENGIEPREHALCYNGFFPDWLKGKPREEEKRLIEKRMAEISSRYADKIGTIEVTNEMFWANGKTEFYKSPDYIDFCYKTAEKYFKNNTLCINEWSSVWESNANPWDNYYVLIENALLKGGRIDAIGMQYHVFHRKEKYFEETRKLYDLSQLFNTLDLYAKFGKPIQITEVTVPAFTDGKADEQLQADILEKLYSLWFSHPSVGQIIYWNLADGYAAFTTPGNMAEGENYYRGGLLRFDLSEKPSYKTLYRLIKKVWTTDEEIVADKNGRASFKGFYGEYEITVGDRKFTANFDVDGKEIAL